MPALSDLDNDILQTQTRLNALMRKKAQYDADMALINAQRPPGIPLNWVAEHDGTGANIRITAWYDPAKFGSGFRAIP